MLHTLPAKQNLTKQTKKAVLFILTLLFSFTAFSQSFITQWKTDNPGVSNSNQIEIPMLDNGTYSYTVNWGDGYSTTFTEVSSPLPPKHTYTWPGGTYTVTITHNSGTFPGLAFNNTGDRRKLISIDSWGTQTWPTFENAFFGCVFLNDNSLSTSSPVFASGISMANAFYNCFNFNGNLSTWDVSGVTNMSNLFINTLIFNSDISSWNTTNVTSMLNLFNGATSFNQNISGWNTSNVTNMFAMFKNASAFNQNLGSWNLSSISNIGQFLDNSGLSTTNYDASLNGWNANPITPIGLSIGVSNLVYCNAGDAARINLEMPLPSGRGWTFIGHSTCSTLPIELTNFEAKKNERTVRLNWETATEINNDFFGIERSSDGEKWETIVEIKGAGNSNQTLNYTVNDLKPLNGLAYYKLKQTDFDGQFTYSKTISINSSVTANETDFSVYPNPSENFITIEASTEVLSTIKVYNILGKKVSTKTLITSEKKKTLDLTNLPSGIYYINGNGISTKFHKGNF